MAKVKSVYVCSECGAEAPRWEGQCRSCGAWNTLVEELVHEKAPERKQASAPAADGVSMRLDEVSGQDESRIPSGIGELDRVLGGGIVRGSMVLVSGEPGIGKSTILLQLCREMSASSSILYVSGEESPGQIRMRADRLKVNGKNMYVMSETDIDIICRKAVQMRPGLLVIDSIQTMALADLSSAPGSVAQVRECTAALMRVAKGENIPVFIVGHVNKEGSIAGPKVMEHMVDTVLYFEGERTLDHRILRAVKNRFGSTNEIGVFQMTGDGLVEIPNPSELFTREKPQNVSGIATVCVMEGSRPILAEVQSLVAQTSFPSPRRVAVGFDYSRFNLILAVLEKRCKMFFGNSDAYVNVIGGLRLYEPAADLGVAVSLASGLKDFVIPDDTLLIGELGLAGEVRSVSMIEKRVTEASRCGYRRIIIPEGNRNGISCESEIISVSYLKDVFNKL